MLAASVTERLGAEFRAVTPTEAQQYGLDAGQGVAIVRVDPKGPLGQVGFEVGDIIAAVNGQPIEGLEGFDALVSTLKPGQKIALFGIDHRSGNSGYVQVVVK
jgi:serine protease Do